MLFNLWVFTEDCWLVACLSSICIVCDVCDFRVVQIDLFGQGAGMVVCEVFRKWAVFLMNKLVWFGLETACAIAVFCVK